MSNRTNVSSFLICLRALTILVIWLSSGCEPDYRKQWVGAWQFGDDSDFLITIRRDGTITRDDSEFMGTYSLKKNRCTVTLGSGSSHEYFTGKWERLADKLVIYIDPPPDEVQAKLFRRRSYEALVLTKINPLPR